MKVVYKNKKTQKLCTNIVEAKRKYGPDVGYALIKLSILLENADNLKDVSGYPQYRLHQLKGDKKYQYSITILKSSKYRLIIYPLDEDENVLKSFDNEMLMFVRCVCIKIEEVSEHYE